MSPAMSQWTFGPLGFAVSQWSPLAPQCHNGPLMTGGHSVTPWSFGSMQPCSVTMVSFGCPVSQWTTDDMRPCSVTMDLLFHAALQGHKGLLVSRGPTISQWSSWFCGDPQGHNGLHDSMVPFSVTMVSVIPWCLSVSQWLLGSMRL